MRNQASGLAAVRSRSVLVSVQHREDGYEGQDTVSGERHETGAPAKDIGEEAADDRGDRRGKRHRGAEIREDPRRPWAPTMSRTMAREMTGPAQAPRACRKRNSDQHADALRQHAAQARQGEDDDTRRPAPAAARSGRRAGHRSGWRRQSR